MPVDQAVLAEARAFFAAHLRPRSADDRVTFMGAAGGDEAVEEGRAHLRLLASERWVAPGWPAEHGGRGADPETSAAVSAELSRYDGPDLYPFAIGLAMVGPTVLVHGTDDQKQRWLPGILDGSEVWCQLFSEPDAGSDLAGLRSRASLDGERWTVAGQKTWSSRAHYAAWGLLLARTDPSVPKHAGITAFGLPMVQAGVEVRPLRQVNGDLHFNEVFMDGAVVDDRDRIDEPGAGWRVGMTTLGFERAGLGAGGPTVAGAVRREQLIDHVRAHGAADDPVVRQRLVRALSDMDVARMTALRARDRAKAGQAPGPEGSGGKLRLSATTKAIAGLAVDVQGLAGVAGGDPEWDAVFLTAPSISIRGGTDEIQRNIVGERVLGLPPEPRVDKGIPFSST
ncbi:MAG: acyl-CoA dehydrogenase family protein [Acidimicrobiia bacterium]|nr:acyl-CoA dehydrogenase family protein [Acidimicrobiia bacterium]